MAKEQNLSLNPTKISGQCGRLMCCLKYEQDTYEQTLKRLPKVGKDLVTPDGVGVITEINAIKERVKVRLRVDDDTFDVREYSIDEVRRPGPEDSSAIREAPKSQEKRSRRTPEAEEGAESEESPKKKRYPHQKAPKNLSTDQFFEKLNQSGDSAPAREHKRKRSGRGKAMEGQFEVDLKDEAPKSMTELSQSVETQSAPESTPDVT